MKSTIKAVGILLVFAFTYGMTALSVQAQNTPITIMPMGDSITAGTDYYTNTASGYRDPLYRDLIASGITNFTFVGNNTGTYGQTRTLIDANEVSNNGFGGDWIVDLYNGLISSAAPTDGGSGPAGGFWLDTIKPTFILLQAGTNDAKNNQTASQMQASMDTLLQEIHTKSPQTIVFIAGIPPFSLYTGDNQNIATYNTDIQTILVPKYSFTRFVDNNTPFYDGGNTSNAINTLLLGNDNNVGIHPTRYGYPILAANWAAAIRTYMGTSPTLYSVTVVNGTINNVSSTGSYPAGTVLTINATPPNGSQFGYWSASSTQALTALQNPYNTITTYVVPAANTTITDNASSGGAVIPNGTYEISGGSDIYQSNSITPNGIAVAVSGTSVVGQAYTDATSQQWVLNNVQTTNGNNIVQLSVPGTSDGTVLGVNTATSNPTYLDVESYASGNTNQQWIPSQVLGITEIVNVGTGLDMSDYYVNFGNPIAEGSTGDESGYNPLAPVGYSSNQFFTFYPVGGSAPPAAPTNLTATSNSGQVGLSWSAVSGATSYTLYRGTTGNGIANMAVLANNLTTTSYTDSALTGPPPQPSNLTANGGSGQVGLSWTAGTTRTYYYEVVANNTAGPSPGSNDASASPTGGPVVTGYNIYRSLTSYNEGTTPYATSTSASYTDTGVTSGQAYFYDVASISITGVSSGSNQATATPTGAGAPVINSSTSASGTVGTAFTYQISATNSPTSYSASGLPAGLSVSTTTGAITGTPSAAGTSSVTIGATNSTGTGTATLTITIAAAGSPPVISSSGTATGTVGAAFSYQITASNSPTSYNASGLPAGLSVSTTTGAISGTPSASGTTSATITATNASGTGSKTLSITIALASPVITSSNSASGTVGSAFSYQIVATNSPTSYSATGLPAGLSVSTTTGAITGTPSASGTSSVTIGATNSTGTGTATLTVTIAAASAPPVINSSTSASGTAGTAFSYQITATNNPTSYSASGLPAGLSVSTSTGAITGTPTTSGTSSVTIGATNASGTGTATLTLTIAASGTTTITSVQFPQYYNNGIVNPMNAANNYTAGVVPVQNWNVADTNTGTSPASNSTLVNSSGSPLGSTILINSTGGNTAINFTYSGYTVNDSTNNSAFPSPIWYQAGGLTDAYIAGGSSFNETGAAETLTVSGLSTGTTYNLIVYVTSPWWDNGGSVPASVSLGGVTKYIETSNTLGVWTQATSTTAGSPTTGNYVEFTGLTGSTSQTVTVTGVYAGLAGFQLVASGSSGGSAPVINSSTSASGTVGSAFSYQITASNTPTSYSATGLPAGLSVNTSTGAITGTPTATGTSTVTIGATNASGTGTATLTLTVSAAKPVITSSTSASGTVGSAFTYQITASNSPTSYSATGLPSGLSVSTSTGAITGTPTASGTSSVTIGATNAGGTGTATLTVTIAAAGAAPVINSSTSASGTVGSAFTYQITATNTPTSYSASGLPAGLSVSTSTGAITGTPTATGTSSVTIGATNATGTGTATLSLTISAAGSQSSIAVQFVGSGTALLSTDSAGVPAVAQTNWIPLTGSTFSSVALTDNTGTATTARLTGSADGTYFCGSSFASGTGNYKLCTGELYDGTITTETNSTTISSIPYAQYDVYVYGECDAATRGATFTITPAGGSASSLSFQTEGNASSWTAGTSTWNGSGTAPTLAVGNYVHFTGLTASSFVLKFGGVNNVAMNGIQIVKTSTGATPPAITSSTSASGTVGTAFTYQITASNSPTSYSATGLPAGLSVSTTTGAITGTPSVSGTSSVTIGATNSGGTGTATLTLTIAAAGNPPAITSSTSASGTVGTAFTYQITASNTPTSYSATGLPGGLSVSTSTGAITGTPTATGTSSVTIGATNAYGTGTATLTVTISAAGTQSSIAMQFVGQGTAMLSTDSAGVPGVAQTNWKPLTGSSFSNVALTDNTGAATTATLSGGADGTYFCLSNFASGTGDNKLCSGELYDGTITTETNSMTIASIPYAKYDVYIYGESDAGTRGATFTITPSGGSASSLSFQTESNGSSWTAGTSTWNGSGTAPTLAVGNYVHFTGLTASSFVLKFGGVNNVSMEGIQIVKTQ
jgi:lysophospholipase L1-like esterase